jgi:hypothetical protein
MEHRGIRYTLRAGIERNHWTVVIHPGWACCMSVPALGWALSNPICRHPRWPSLPAPTGCTKSSTMDSALARRDAAGVRLITRAGMTSPFAFPSSQWRSASSLFGAV